MLTRIFRFERSLALLFSGFLYYFLLYHTPRSDFYQLLGIFGGLFLLYGLLLKERKTFPIGWIIAVGIGFRLIAFFALPELSDDYFRFIWDGRLLAHGVNPFDHLPSEIDPGTYPLLGLNPELFAGLNSPDYFTIYPPVCQGIFLLAAWLTPHSTYGAVLVMKIFFLLAEAGSLLLMGKLLRRWELPVDRLAFYAFNPLVVVELTGNLHFEALMVFFLLLALWWLSQDRWLRSTLPFALAVCSKLLPLIFLPLLIRRLGWVKAGIYGALAGGLSMLAFAPLFDVSTLLHLLQSVELYFRSFEFNASVFYLVREAGYLIADYDIVGVAGLVLAGLTLVSILLFAAREQTLNWQTLPEAMLWSLTIYFGLATTVHPWYICTLVALTVFSKFRFPLIWSMLLPLTYGTYQTAVYQESMGLVILEYGVLLLFILSEFRKSKTKALLIR